MIEEYLKKWYPIIHKLRILGLETISFDSGVVCVQENNANPIHISQPLLEIIIKLFDKAYPEISDNELCYILELPYHTED